MFRLEFDCQKLYEQHLICETKNSLFSDNTLGADLKVGHENKS